MTYCPKCASELVSRAIDNHERRVCARDGCGFIFWNNPIPVVAIIVETKDGVLLAHNKTWPSGMFSIITGFLERGECPEGAAVREMKEELGLDAQEVTFLGNFPFSRLNQLMIAFHIRATGSVVLNEELDDFKFVPREQLLGYSTRHQFEVAEWLEKLRVEE